MERSLLLRYGYPFARIESALKACSASKAIEIVSLDRDELGRLIGERAAYDRVKHRQPRAAGSIRIRLISYKPRQRSW